MRSTSQQGAVLALLATGGLLLISATWVGLDMPARSGCDDGPTGGPHVDLLRALALTALAACCLAALVASAVRRDGRRAPGRPTVALVAYLLLGAVSLWVVQEDDAILLWLLPWAAVVVGTLLYGAGPAIALAVTAALCRSSRGLLLQGLAVWSAVVLVPGVAGVLLSRLFPFCLD